MSKKNKQAEQRFMHYLGVVSDGMIAKAAGLKLAAVTWWRTQRNIKGLGIRRSALDPYMHWFANSTLSPEAIFEIAGHRLPPKAMNKYLRDPHGMSMRLARRAAFLRAYEGLELQPIPPNLWAPRSKIATLHEGRIERGTFGPSPLDEAEHCDLLRQQRGAVSQQQGAASVPSRGRSETAGQEGGESAEESVNATPWRPITVSFKLAIVRGAEAYLSPEDVEETVRAALGDMLSNGDLLVELPLEVSVGVRMKQAAGNGGDAWDIAVVFGD